MHLRLILIASALAVTACGGQDADALARRACLTLDVYKGLVVPPSDKAPRLDDMLDDAKAAAKQDSEFAVLSSAMAAWTAGAKRREVLTRNGFESMTASQTAELDASVKVADRQYALLSAECRKARER